MDMATLFGPFHEVKENLYEILLKYPNSNFLILILIPVIKAGKMETQIFPGIWSQMLSNM